MKMMKDGNEKKDEIRSQSAVFGENEREDREKFRMDEETKRNDDEPQTKGVERKRKKKKRKIRSDGKDEEKEKREKEKGKCDTSKVQTEGRD